MRWALVETCAGSSALTLHLLGSKHALLPYQGSKWKVRRQLEALLRHKGLEGPPSAVWLNDLGPFGWTWLALREHRHAVADRLEVLGRKDPRGVFDRLQGSSAAVDRAQFAAEHLFLQRLSHSGKAVLCKDGRWASPGFNRNSAYGCDGTTRFGPIKPMIPHLVKVIRALDFGKTPTPVTRSDARELDLDTWLRFVVDPAGVDRVVFYVDPPYAGTTGYGGTWSKDDTRAVVHRILDGTKRSRLPVLVVVSESNPVELGPHAAAAEKLLGRTDGSSPFRSTKEEWVTFVSTNWPEQPPASSLQPPARHGRGKAGGWPLAADG